MFNQKKNEEIECDVSKCCHNCGCNCTLSHIKVGCAGDHCTECENYEEKESE